MWESGKMGYCDDMGNTIDEAIVESDSRSRIVLPGHPNQRFLLRENADGSLLLQPARVVSEAQREYDTTPELQDLLARAAKAPTVRRSRHRRP